MIPFPHQVEGARWLAERAFGILADEPRVGKTGAAIMAADVLGARTILVVTTASGRGVWRKAFNDWSMFGRPMQVMQNTDYLEDETQVAIVGWPSMTRMKTRSHLLGRAWDVLILDEGHYAKNYEAKRTQAVLGELVDDGETLATRMALISKAGVVWHLTGTPMPNSPFDLYPVLRANTAARLKANEAKGWPDVTLQAAFKKRYCKVKPMKIGKGYFARRIDVVVGGQNLDELRERCDGLILRRTQQDVGIGAPIFEIFPLVMSYAQQGALERHIDAPMMKVIRAAAESDSTKDLELHLGPLRRLTGAMKAGAVAEAVKEEFESGLDRIVLAYWHKEVGDMLGEALHEFGVAKVDGSTPAAQRDAEVGAFQKGPARVFLAQIAAAGEAIDLSAACEMIIVEPSFQPAQMKQIALRVTNHTQTRQVRVRVATLEGSIDEAVQTSLLRKWSAINEVLTP